MVFTLSSDLSLDALAQLTDKVIDVALPTISKIQVVPLIPEVDQLRAEIEHLQDLISSIYALQCPRYRSQTCPRESSLYLSSSTAPTLWWYHRRFSDKVQKCTSLCNWSGNAPVQC
jgi:hypothetical protein